MADLFGMFKKEEDNSTEIFQALQKLESQKTAVRMELEKSYVSFRTVIALRDNMIVVGKPPGINDQIEKGVRLRFRIPELERDLPLEVYHAHVNLKNGHAVFVCRIPSSFAKGGRGAMRFDASRVTTLNLHLPERGETYRVLDVSQNGVRVYVPMGDLKVLFPQGKPSDRAEIHYDRYVIHLDSYTPRVYKGRSVGLEVTLKDLKDTQTRWESLRVFLESSQDQRSMGRVG
ncbi:MAG: hypothetical protein OEV94_10575 [Deltaproteobacteria bacterium]|nr:hypothetical protein [Deltaproteobacteria bacterium]